jgi:hypothetical protein
MPTFTVTLCENVPVYRDVHIEADGFEAAVEIVRAAIEDSPGRDADPWTGGATEVMWSEATDQRVYSITDESGRRLYDISLTGEYGLGVAEAEDVFWRVRGADTSPTV